MFDDGLFVAVAQTGTGNRVMTSPDGINWTIRTSANDRSWNSVCYGNGVSVNSFLDIGLHFKRPFAEAWFERPGLGLEFCIHAFRSSI